MHHTRRHRTPFAHLSANCADNSPAIVRRVGGLLEEQTDKWQITRHYRSQESLVQLLNSDYPQAPVERYETA